MGQIVLPARVSPFFTQIWDCSVDTELINRNYSSSWFCFSLWSARKRKYIRFQRKIFEVHFRGFLLVVVVLLVVAWVRDQLIQAMRNSDSRERIVFVYRFDSNFHSMFTLQVAGCDFQYGSNFGVPSNPTFRVSWCFISWQSVLTTSHWLCKLWEFFSVFCREVLSDFNCFQESCISTKDFPLVLCTFAIKFLMREFQSKVWVSLSKILLARTMGQMSYQNKFLRSYMARFVFFTQIWDCSVNSELITRNYCAKNSFNRSLISAEVWW